jgi:uncharacterized protein YciI
MERELTLAPSTRRSKGKESVMNESIYVIFLENAKPLSREAVEQHVSHLRALDDADKLVLCGPFADYAGGMVAIRAASLEEAHAVANKDPFVAGGFRTYSIRTLEQAHRENGYLL